MTPRDRRVRSIHRARHRRRRRVLISSGLLAVNTTVIAVVASPVVAVAVVGTLVVHEFGHYYTAWARRGDPDPPILLTVGLVSVGVTRIRRMTELSSSDRVAIINAGPRTALLTLALVAPVVYAMGSVIAMRIVAMTVLGEVYGVSLGADGQARRRAVKSGHVR